MRGDVYSLGMANAAGAAAAAAAACPAVTAHFDIRAVCVHADVIAARTEDHLTMKAVAKNPS